MPARLWIMLAGLCAAIGLGSAFALYVGIQEVRLHRAGPLRQLLAEELRADTRGWVQVLGCARHELEVAVDGDGVVVAGERGPRDRIFFVLTPQGECEDDPPPGGLHVMALVQSQNAGEQGLSRLYEKGYTPPPTKVVVDGVIGFGAGDAWRLSIAREALKKKAPALAPGLAGAPLLLKGKRPGSPAIAYATAAAGTHGILLLCFLGWLAVRRRLRGGLPKELMADEDAPAEL